MNGKYEKVFLVSLGCSKNLIDSENMLGLLKRAGFAFAEEPGHADVAVINTCGFLQSAVEEAIDGILEMVALKKKGVLRRIVVTGCMVQRYGYKLSTELPEVDAWLGTGEIESIIQAVAGGDGSSAVSFALSRPEYLADHTVPRVQTTPFYTSYLKIAEGCSHHCSFCMIPRLRGPYRSRTLDSLVREAKDMVASGVRELNLVAQDTTGYGSDASGRNGLEALLRNLAAIKDLAWIRLLYCHPESISDGLLTVVEEEEKICPYLDIPFQHVHPEILRAMKRPVGKETLKELVHRIRSLRRRVYLRTTLLVGFPGETDEMFETLCSFVEEVRFHHLGVFAFSPEQGTAAYRLEPRVDPSLAEMRRELLLKRQRAISTRLNQESLGQVVPVLIEGECAETPLLLSGRTPWMAPDVDGRVLINKGTGVPGQIMPVRITETHAYDLIGEIEE